MIITRTPYRISFVGGGTDLRNYYKNSQGKVISTTIDKYIYVVIKRQVGIVEYKYRIYEALRNQNHMDKTTIIK